MSEALAGQILKQYRAADMPPEPVSVFDRQLHVKHWSAAERAAWENLVFDRSGEKPEVRREIFMAAAVALSLVNGDGGLVFTEEQIPAVAELDSTELEKAYVVAVRVNGLDRNLVNDAKKN